MLVTSLAVFLYKISEHHSIFAQAPVSILQRHRFAFAYCGYKTASPVAGYESVQHNPLRYETHFRFDSKRPNIVLIITDRPNQAQKITRQ